MKQKEIFLEGEGNEWFWRNAGTLGQYDPVSDVLDELRIFPHFVLEVGCANGWRLARLRDKYGCGVLGVEPSIAAGMEAARLRIPVHQMTASALPVQSGGFDLIIYGFCLYLTDPDDWFGIVAEADRVLQENGHIVIHDFAVTGKPYGCVYAHNEKITAYHVDFARFWLGHPAYELIHYEPQDREDAVWVLKKQPRFEVSR